ncbi:MAG TPA: hypothetical protein VK859_09270 [bacterium]|jgi:hypothetical protein|nr:hypothetical protein [bacterium]
MKKILAIGLALLFTAAASSVALADGTACNGKKCNGHHHGHKHGSTKGPATNSTGPTK